MLNICDSTGIPSNLIHQPVYMCHSKLSCYLQISERCISVEGKYIFILNQLDMDLFLKDILEKWEQENVCIMWLRYKNTFVVFKMFY